MSERENFIYPHYSFHGDVSPESVVFDANLQEFAHKVSYVCNLQNGGKISQEAAYQEIKHLWKELRQSRKEMGIGDDKNNGGT